MHCASYNIEFKRATKTSITHNNYKTNTYSDTRHLTYDKKFEYSGF